MDLIFLGNSYTFQNDLDVVVQSIFEQSGDTSATAVRLADGGLTWADHVERTQSNELWQDALVTGAATYDWGILQEQSQIPGFYGEDPIWEESASAGATLHELLYKKNAHTILLLTWGRRDGDSSNSWLYPDFSTMQDQLTEGYLAYQANFSSTEYPVWIAPAGLAYAAVHAAEADPLATDALFYRLYVEDGSHPSQLGTWLVASTIFSTITGQSTEGLIPPFAIDTEEADYLAQVAFQVVSTGVGGLDYPWESTGDSGATDSDSDSSPDSALDSVEESAQSENDSEGCGCNHIPVFPGLLIVGVLSLAGRRVR